MAAPTEHSTTCAQGNKCAAIEIDAVLRAHHQKIAEFRQRMIETGFSGDVREHKDLIELRKVTDSYMPKYIADRKMFAELMDAYCAISPDVPHNYHRYEPALQSLALSRNISKFVTDEVEIVDSDVIEADCMRVLRIANKFSETLEEGADPENDRYRPFLTLVRDRVSDLTTYAENRKAFSEAATARPDVDTIQIVGNSVVFPYVPLSESRDVGGPVAEYVTRFFEAQAPLPEEKRKRVKIVVPFVNTNEVDNKFPFHIYKKLFCSSIARFTEFKCPCEIYILNAEHFFATNDVNVSPFTMEECVHYFMAYKIRLVFATKHNPNIPPYAWYFLGKRGLLYYAND